MNRQMHSEEWGLDLDLEWFGGFLRSYKGPMSLVPHLSGCIFHHPPFTLYSPIHSFTTSSLLELSFIRTLCRRRFSTSNVFLEYKDTETIPLPWPNNCDTYTNRGPSASLVWVELEVCRWDLMLWAHTADAVVCRWGRPRVSGRCQQLH